MTRAGRGGKPRPAFARRRERQVVRHNQDPDDDYVVMADPEGNEFCVCAVNSAVAGGQ